MTEKELSEIADKAALIVKGYAFTAGERGLVSILNLFHPDCAMVVNDECEIIATNMDEIEQGIVLDLFKRNLQFLEVQHAEVLQV